MRYGFWRTAFFRWFPFLPRLGCYCNLFLAIDVPPPSVITTHEVLISANERETAPLRALTEQRDGFHMVGLREHVDRTNGLHPHAAAR